MNIQLSKEDLVNMVQGTTPNYGVMSHPLITITGSYTGGFKDEWNWHHSKLMELEDYQLMEIYNVCKDSWKKH